MLENIFISRIHYQFIILSMGIHLNVFESSFLIERDSSRHIVIQFQLNLYGDCEFVESVPILCNRLFKKLKYLSFLFSLYIYILKHIHTHAQTYMHTHTHTHIHTPIHTQTHTHTHTHTHYIL